jgi:outer membrane protein OmpA-like peptidoglycan-associated protein
MRPVACLAALFAVVLLAVPASAEDAEGCKDHPMFNRMPGFNLGECSLKEFDGYKFPTGTEVSGDDGKFQVVEGKWSYYTYERPGDLGITSAAQIFRNFENALRQINATIVAKVVEPGNSYSFITAKLVKPGSEVWILVTGSDSYYNLTIVEKQAMEQVIQASDMFAALQKDGFIALDIRFDTDKATIKTESQPIIDQIAALMKANPDLKVGIEGHTDNTGKADRNKKLSDERAKAVVAAVAAKGIAAARMIPAGFGQDRPVADNRSEEGRAKNRRVEIVKK